VFDSMARGIEPSTCRLTAESSQQAAIVLEIPAQKLGGLSRHVQTSAPSIFGVNLVSNRADCAGCTGHTGS
jgi:hypothetical protein